MFDKTRRKIVFTVVISLLILIVVTMTTIYLSNLISTRQRQEATLKTYVEEYSLGDDKIPEKVKPGEVPQPPDGEREPKKEDSQFKFSTFYSVAYSKTGEVLKISNGNERVQSEESILNLASKILESGKTSGYNGNIFYLVSAREDYTLVAMIDGTLDSNNQNALLRQILIIGASATAVLLVVSIFIAKKIVRPLEENDEKQKRFISDAGHELKTPIAVISANCELLKRQIGENEWLSNIDYENEKMAELVKQLLFLSKTENKAIKETIDFSKLVGGETLPFETLAFEKGKKIDADIEDGISVEGNRTQLKQLVSIMIDNALSHGKGEEISLSLKREKHSAVLSVSNFADELTKEQLAHLFDRFYRTDEARSDGSHYGLGLSIARAVTRAHGGEISADYKDGKAIFTVYIPVKKI